MLESWQSYLEYCFPINQISTIIIYTDIDRFWLTRGLIDVAKINNWKVSISMLDSLEDEDAMEIQQSFAFLSQSTLLVGIFSPTNPSIDLINQIFQPLNSPTGLAGFSLISLQEFPDHFFLDFLRANYDKVKETCNFYETKFLSGTKIHLTSQKGTNVNFVLKSDIVKFPIFVEYNKQYRNRHVLLPATEIIAEIEPHSMNGIMIIDMSISEYVDADELIDPFGLVDKPIILRIVNGIIEEVSGDDHIANRLKSYIFPMNKSAKMITKMGIGIGPQLPPTGFANVDKLLGNTCNFGISDRQIEFIISKPIIEIISSNS